MLIEKAPDALSLDDACRTIACAFGPLKDLAQANPVLDGRAVDGDDEFCHRPRVGRQLIIPKLIYHQCHGFIQGFRLYFNIMRDAVRVRERDAAASHEPILTYSPFIRYIVRRVNPETTEKAS